MNKPFDLSAISMELLRARSIHPKAHNSPHESYGIIKEEFSEFFDEVRKKRHNKPNMKKELIQTAAMCIRAIEDLGL